MNHNNTNLDLSVQLWTDYYNKREALKRLQKSLMELHSSLHIDKETMQQGKTLAKKRIFSYENIK